MSFQPPPGPPPPPPPPPPGGWQPPGPPSGGYGPPPPPPPYSGPPVGPPPPSPWGPAPPPPKKSRKGLFIGLGIGGAVLIVLVIIAVIAVASRVTGGTPLADLRPGQCFNTEKLIAERAERVACAAAHTDEVAGVLRFPAADGAGYPGQQGILDFGKSDCLQQVRGFFGDKTPLLTTQVFVFGPNKAAWSSGDRTVICSLREPTGEKRKGSYLDG